MKFKVNKKYVVDAKSHDEAIKIIKKLQDAMNTYEIHWIDTYSKSKGYDKSFWSFKDTVKANDVAEALKKLSGIVVMRGVGTANCLVVNVASNTATYQWSGKLSELLNKSKEQLGDCDKKSINLDDATASGTADLTRIINEWLGRIKKTGKYDREDIDINGKRVKGRIRLSWNGMPVLSFYPNGGSFYVFKNGSSALDIPYDRNSMTVKQSDINKLVGEIFEASDKANEITSLKNEKPKVVGYVLEGIEGDQSSVARRQMLNKTVSYDKILSFLKTEDDKFRASGKKGYDKAYIDVIYSLGKHKYRVHGARFDVGDGNVDSTLRRELGFPEREIEKFKQTGYSMYVKQVDSVKDGLSHSERVKFISELTLELQKLGYPRDKANDIAIKRADALGDDWRARWGGNISAQVKQEIKFTEPYRDSVHDEDVSLDYLIKDEIEAINGYKAMIAKTKNPKLLDVLSHILSEEVMHVEELRNAQSGNFEIVDSSKKEPHSFSYEGIPIILTSYGWKFIIDGKIVETATSDEAMEYIDACLKKRKFNDFFNDEISPEKQVGLKVTMRDPDYIDFTITNDNQNLYRYEKATGKMRKILGVGPNNFGNAIRGIDRKKIESVAKEVFERNLPFAIIA